MRSGKTDFSTTFQNPNTRFGVIGIVGAAVILLAMVLGLQVIEDTGAIDPFLQQWKTGCRIKNNRGCISSYGIRPHEPKTGIGMNAH